MSSEAKCHCQHCNGPIAFPVEMAGEMSECPHCKMDTRLFIPPPPPPAPPKPATPNPPPNPPPTVPSFAEDLKKIRARTCYQSLRSLINVAQIIGFVGIGIFAFSLVTGISQSPLAASGSSEFALVGFFVSVSMCLGGVVVLIAGKQAALLLVDIADCQIQMAAGRKTQK